MNLTLLSIADEFWMRYRQARQRTFLTAASLSMSWLFRAVVFAADLTGSSIYTTDDESWFVDFRQSYGRHFQSRMTYSLKEFFRNNLKRRELREDYRRWVALLVYYANGLEDGLLYDIAVENRLVNIPMIERQYSRIEADLWKLLPVLTWTTSCKATLHQMALNSGTQFFRFGAS